MRNFFGESSREESIITSTFAKNPYPMLTPDLADREQCGSYVLLRRVYVIPLWRPEKRCPWVRAKVAIGKPITLRAAGADGVRILNSIKM